MLTSICGSHCAISKLLNLLGFIDAAATSHINTEGYCEITTLWQGTFKHNYVSTKVG